MSGIPSQPRLDDTLRARATTWVPDIGATILRRALLSTSPRTRGPAQTSPPTGKDMSQLAQLGLVAYDQWQVSSNGGNYLVAGKPVPASLVPYYSVHALGFQANYILPAKDIALFFKYYDEYSAKARVEGRTIVFGGSWTLKFPKPAPKKP